MDELPYIFFDNGKWSSGRVLNGDERSMSGFGQYAEVRHYIYCKETTDETYNGNTVMTTFFRQKSNVSIISYSPKTG